MKEDIFETIEIALARKGYRLMDRYDDTLVIRDVQSNTDFEITITETA